MSITTRTSPTDGQTKNAFGQGVGLVHEFGIALGKQRVTPSMLKRVVSDPLIQAQIGALLRGESLVPATDLHSLVEREMPILGRFSELAGSAMPSQSLVEEAFRKAQNQFGSVTEHDRFLPHGLSLDILHRAIYRWNEEQAAACGTGIKLNYSPREEWWRSESSVQQIVTEAGIFRADLGKLVAAYDLQGRPFNLTVDEQEAWASEQGGDGVSSAEEALYIVVRKLMERNVAPWGPGAWIRCRNTCVQGYRLTVDWDADDGLRVGSSDLLEYWSCGALPRKFAAL